MVWNWLAKVWNWLAKLRSGERRSERTLRAEPVRRREQGRVVDADEFLDLLDKSGLVLEPNQLASVIAELRQQHDGGLPDAADVADTLIDTGVITRWQTESLLRGKYKGFWLGRHVLLGHLGSGGMSSVYLAKHMVTHNMAAIKVLPVSKVEDAAYLARFEREAQAAAKLTHRNIVRAHGIDREGKTYYILMDYIEGQSLQHLVRERGPLPYHEAADFIAQTADGLQHAHDHGVIHRDIKPANLLVDRRGTIKILEIGFATFRNGDRPSLMIEHDPLIAISAADYLAPEQAINSHLVDGRADIYSLGCTFYFLLMGHPPFPEGTLPQRLMAHQRKVPSNIIDDRPDAPPVLVDICLRMMMKSPAGRYQSMREVADALRRWTIGFDDAAGALA